MESVSGPAVEVPGVLQGCLCWAQSVRGGIPHQERWAGWHGIREGPLAFGTLTLLQVEESPLSHMERQKLTPVISYFDSSRLVILWLASLAVNGPSPVVAKSHRKSSWPSSNLLVNIC